MKLHTRETPCKIRHQNHNIFPLETLSENGNNFHHMVAHTGEKDSQLINGVGIPTIISLIK